MTAAKGEISKLKVSNIDLLNQVKRLRNHNPERESHDKLAKAQQTVRSLTESLQQIKDEKVKTAEKCR